MPAALPSLELCASLWRPCLLGHVWVSSFIQLASLKAPAMGLALGIPEWALLLSSRTQSGMGHRLVKHLFWECIEYLDRYLYRIWEISKGMSESRFRRESKPQTEF